MKLADGINLAYRRQWSMINTFTVQINMPDYLIDAVGHFGEDINLSIKDFMTPDFANEPIESFIANRWVIHNGRDTLYRFTITFRDYDQLNLYSKFMKIYYLTKENYFDDIAMSIIIVKDADWMDEADKIFMSFDGAMVEAVSNLSFNNETENQIAEFTVSFKCNAPNYLF